MMPQAGSGMARACLTLESVVGKKCPCIAGALCRERRGDSNPDPLGVNEVSEPTELTAPGRA